MKAIALSQFPMPWLSCLGLLLFMTVFFGSLLWTYRAAAKPAYERFGRLPLEEDRK